MIDNRAYERLFAAINTGDITRRPDFVYRNKRGVTVDDVLYSAADRGWVVLLADGSPQVTEMGRQWLAGRPRRAERMPATPVFAEARNG